MIEMSFGMQEKDIQHFLATSIEAQNKLKKIINIDENDILFKREETFTNGITVDLMIYSNSNKRIYSLIECKGTQINVTDYVRGIGQTLQYEYFFEENIPPRNEYSYSYNAEFQTLFVITSDFMKKTNINIAKFKYPETVKIIEINTENKNLREIDPAEIKKIDRGTDVNTIALNFYYFRDNRIFELFILLKELVIKSLAQYDDINRVEMGNFLVRERSVINNGNWRNAFITLSSLGFIDSTNRPTDIGFSLTNLSFEEFAYYIYENYLKDYINLILEVIDRFDLYNASNKEIANKIKETFNGKDILYLTQSKGRYLSSFLNIMRDDYGILSFQPRSSDRTLNYDISTSTRDFIIKNIRERSNAYKYL